ncbi:MAG: hypothetical protein GY777_01870 [Candidatus Brocadiaceae bacterium]|jgi:DNA replication initiation complex subunit (GINS family)|nr:hypothetical protein [Candidatus Brocadiaceae bacterium]
MKIKEVVFRDPVVERVVDKFVSRSDVGFEKYGRTLDSERKEGYKDLLGYLNDIQEELMDAILYIQTAREELSQPTRQKPKSSADLDFADKNNGLPYYVTDIAQ